MNNEYDDEMLLGDGDAGDAGMQDIDNDENYFYT